MFRTSIIPRYFAIFVVGMGYSRCLTSSDVTLIATMIFALSAITSSWQSRTNWFKLSNRTQKPWEIRHHPYLLYHRAVGLLLGLRFLLNILQDSLFLLSLHQTWHLIFHNKTYLPISLLLICSNSGLLEFQIHMVVVVVVRAFFNSNQVTTKLPLLIRQIMRQQDLELRNWTCRWKSLIHIRFRNEKNLLCFWGFNFDSWI